MNRAARAYLISHLTPRTAAPLTPRTAAPLAPAGVSVRRDDGYVTVITSADVMADVVARWTKGMASAADERGAVLAVRAALARGETSGTWGAGTTFEYGTAAGRSVGDGRWELRRPGDAEQLRGMCLGRWATDAEYARARAAMG